MPGTANLVNIEYPEPVVLIWFTELSGARLCVYHRAKKQPPVASANSQWFHGHRNRGLPHSVSHAPARSAQTVNSPLAGHASVTTPPSADHTSPLLHHCPPLTSMLHDRHRDGALPRGMLHGSRRIQPSAYSVRLVRPFRTTTPSEMSLEILRFSVLRDRLNRTLNSFGDAGPCWRLG